MPFAITCHLAAMTLRDIQESEQPATTPAAEPAAAEAPARQVHSGLTGVSLF